MVQKYLGINILYGKMNREKQMDGAKWADKNQCWRDVDDELPIIEEGKEGEEPFLGLFWTEDQEMLYDDDDTKYDKDGLVLDIVYYYGDGIWKYYDNYMHKAFVKYWLPIPNMP